MKNELTTETKIKNIHQRLHAVMESIKYVQKEDKKVNGQYRFVSHDAVASLVRPELVKNGILLITSVKNHIQDGNRTEVDLDLTFCNIDNPSDTVSLSAFGYGIDTQDKGPGKAISYAVKYAMLKMFCLETGDDPENDNINYDYSKTTPLEARKQNTNEEYDFLVSALQSTIVECKNADDLNEFMDVMRDTNHIKDSKNQAWGLAKIRAKELGCVFDKDKGMFE